MRDLSGTALNPTELPKPTMISVNNVILEVFEAGKQNAMKTLNGRQ
ncbi:hypothetical protein [Chryseobacterium sp. JK1]